MTSDLVARIPSVFDAGNRDVDGGTSAFDDDADIANTPPPEDGPKKEVKVYCTNCDDGPYSTRMDHCANCGHALPKPKKSK
jgi:hypothetical protein